MKINLEHVGELLRPHGFGLSTWSRVERKARFSRPGEPDGIFESLEFWVVGRAGDAVAGIEEAAVARFACGHGMLEYRTIMELATDTSRGLEEIPTRAEARAWESRFAELGPDSVRRFSLDKGPEILRSTRGARESSLGFIAQLPRQLCAERHVLELSGRLTNAQRESASRMSRLAMFVPHADAHYLAACLAIHAYADDVEPGYQQWLGANPRDIPELMWRIQFIADELIARDDDLMRALRGERAE